LANKTCSTAKIKDTGHKSDANVFNCVAVCNVASQFQCDNGNCASRSIVCNGFSGGCTDGSDERDCRKCYLQLIESVNFIVSNLVPLSIYCCILIDILGVDSRKCFVCLFSRNIPTESNANCCTLEDTSYNNFTTACARFLAIR